MGTTTVLVKNADRMITSVTPVAEGIGLKFADGCHGVIPFAEIPEINAFANLADIELPNPYEILLRSTDGETVELPWDFARHFCDEKYRPKVEIIAAAGRGTLGNRIRYFREASGMTQELLAESAGIARGTLLRIEHGDQSPRHENLLSISQALGCQTSDLVVGGFPETLTS